ncbi:MAG TPA: ABC transporter permease [Verrucomicrobiales bacterium]|nr:ABC transporter permease [Verrucomicrobiales bacterium]
MKEPSRRWGEGLGRMLQALGPVLGLAVVLGLFALFPETRASMFTPASMKLILTQTVIVAIAALGMTMVIVSGGIDLSAGSVVALCGVVAATLAAQGHSLAAAAAGAVGTGALLGLLNGSVIAGARMTPFIVTLGSMGIARGTAKWLADNRTVNYPRDHPINSLMARRNLDAVWDLPPGVWVAAGLAIATGLVMSRSVFGRHVFAVGSSEAAARLCGVRVRWTKLCVYVAAGSCAGLAGLMQASRLNQGDPSVALGLELEVIAAVVIGGASLSGGVGSVAGAMVGALIMAVLRSGSGQMDWPNYVQEITIGAVIILAVWLDRLRNRARVRGG